MDSALNTPTEIPVPLDARAQDAVLIAALLGASGSDEVFVSFTTLFIGLLFVRLDRAVSPLFGDVDLDALHGWQTEASRSLNIDVILEEKGCSRTDAERYATALWSGDTLGWPSGRPLLSISARDMLRQAVDQARETRESSVVTPVDIMASYLYSTPSGHQKQVDGWGLTTDTIARIGAMLSGNARGDTPGAELPQYDEDTQIILSAATSLADCWRNHTENLIASETLLVAVVETVPFLSKQNAGEALVLRNILHADTSASPYRERRDTTFAIPSNLVSPLTSQVMGKAVPTSNIKLILETAERLALAASPGGILAPRHLVVALISNFDGSDRSSVSTDWLDEAGVDKEELRFGLAEAIKAHATDYDAVWSALLLRTNLSMVATARSDTIPDDPRAEDKLGLLSYADAIGALVAAEDQKPPLSIAVFGPWGSGKSFFMAMIRSAAKAFALEGAAAFAANAPTPFLRRVAAIEFNAWHYADGNLWASLVHTILIGLQKELSPEESQSVFQEVLDKLLLKEAAQLEAANNVKNAELLLTAREKELEEAEKAASEKRQDEQQISTVGVLLEEVWHEALGAVAPAAKDGKVDEADARDWVKSVGDSVTNAADYLGRPELAGQVPTLQQAAMDVTKAGDALKVQIVDIRELLDEAKAGSDKGLSLLTWLANAGVRTRDWFWPAAIALAVLLCFIALAAALERWGAQAAAATSSTAAFVLPLLGSLAVGVGWARRHVAKAARAFAVLGSIRERLEKRQEQRLAERSEELAKAQLAVAAAEAEADRRRAEVETANTAVRQAKEELHAATSPERLKQFIAQRLAEGDYQRHLGLIHTIRGDFERLEGILRDIALKLPDKILAGTGTTNQDGDKPSQPVEAPIQRVVLYIDDLDRCPPLRVVEVLEAVHLLLAFKLFVVVVGVDIRWVSQALRERYPRQLGSSAGVAAPTDYLEKVFQIPFWLPAMDAKAGGKLLGATLGAVTSPKGNRPPPSDVPRGRPSEEPISPHATDGTSNEPLPRHGARPEPSTMQQAKPPDIQMITQALTLGETERRHLIEMAAAVGASPRRTIRFANLYRLLKASLSPAERRGFVTGGGKSGSYDGALILLAAATGAPRATRALIASLSKDKPIADAEAYLNSSFDPTARSVPPVERAAFTAARTSALAVADKAALIHHLRLWAPRVACFIFDENTETAESPQISIVPTFTAGSDDAYGQSPVAARSPSPGT